MGKLLIGSDAALQYMWVSLRARFAKVRSGELERGASAVEWVVISFITVTIVAVAGFLITSALRTKATNVGTCIAGASGTNNGC